MERQSVEDADHEPSGGDAIDELGLDETEFSSVEDVGDEPSENPNIDDV